MGSEADGGDYWAVARRKFVGGRLDILPIGLIERWINAVSKVWRRT